MPTPEQSQAKYDALRARHEPRIGELSGLGDKYAAKMRRLFDAASDAWEEGDGARAKSLSEEARAEQARSEKANKEANALRQELAAALKTVQRAQHNARSDTPRSPSRTSQRDHLRGAGVEVVGFRDEPLWRNVLNTLPASGFRDIRRIQYIDQIHPQVIGEVTNRFAPGKAVEITVYRDPIEELDASTLRYLQAWTLFHEYAHVVFDRCLSEKKKVKWGELYNRRRSDPDAAWLSKRARESLREDFSECFAAYALNPEALASADPERYSVIEKIYKAL